MENIIVAATQNKHKIKEIEEITKEFGMSIISRDDAGVPPVDIVEDGSTFEENSYKKAYEIMTLCGRIPVWRWTASMGRRVYIPPDLPERTATTRPTTRNSRLL